MSRIAIIGAGLSGLTLARELSRHQVRVTVFEKSRGVGGRMSTRYAAPFCFDHGAQYFTARTPEFQEFLAPFRAAGTVAEWTGDVVDIEPNQPPVVRLRREPMWVASPNMNSLCKAMAEGVTIRTNVEVAPLEREASGAWRLRDKTGVALGSFDWVLSTAPPVQTARLLGEHLPAQSALRQVSMQGCHALMLGFNRPWEPSWIAASLHERPIAWVAANSTKPGRDPLATSVVVHSSNDWAEAHIDDNLEEVQPYLLEQLEQGTGLKVADATYVSTHRWRYALVKEPREPGYWMDPAMKLASTGDWSIASRIEDVWRSAMQLTGALAGELLR